METDAVERVAGRAWEVSGRGRRAIEEDVEACEEEEGKGQGKG